MSFEEFLEKQSSVYNKFATARAGLVNEGKFLPDPFVSENKGVYLIGLRPPAEVQSILEAFAGQLKKLDGFAVYDGIHRHTTLGDYGVQVGFKSTESDREKLGEVFDLIKAQLALIPVPYCRYNGFTFNETTVILMGQTNEAFLDAAEMVVETGRNYGVELRLPWGSHVTLARRLTAGGREDVFNLNHLCNKFDAKLQEWYFRLGPPVLAELSCSNGQLQFVEL